MLILKAMAYILLSYNQENIKQEELKNGIYRLL